MWIIAWDCGSNLQDLYMNSNSLRDNLTSISFIDRVSGWLTLLKRCGVEWEIKLKKNQNDCFFLYPVPGLQ